LFLGTGLWLFHEEGGVFDKLDIAEEGLSSFQSMSAESMWFPGIAENLRAKILHIDYAEDVGPGTMDPSDIQILGTNIEEARKPCNPLERQKQTML
jgi:hypothetical protein